MFKMIFWHSLNYTPLRVLGCELWAIQGSRLTIHVWKLQIGDWRLQIYFIIHNHPLSTIHIRSLTTRHRIHRIYQFQIPSHSSLIIHHSFYSLLTIHYSPLKTQNNLTSGKTKLKPRACVLSHKRYCSSSLNVVLPINDCNPYHS